MSDARAVRAVSFDLDGTLYDDARARPWLLWSTFPRWRTLRVGRRVREELRGWRVLAEKRIDGVPLWTVLRRP